MLVRTNCSLPSRRWRLFDPLGRDLFSSDLFSMGVLFDRFFEPLPALFDLADPFGRTGFGAARFERGDNEVVVSFDLPGVDPSEIDVTVSGQILEVKVESESASGEGSNESGRHTLKTRRFVQRMRLDSDVDVEAISAEAKNGVLTLRIPLRDAAPARRIEVRDVRYGRAADEQPSEEE